MHENDGLIFTINQCPYYPGTCQEIFKWKPAELNTVDFELKQLGFFPNIGPELIWGLYVNDWKEKKLFDFMVFDPENQEQVALETKFKAELEKNKNAEIVIECSFVRETTN